MTRTEVAMATRPKSAGLRSLAKTRRLTKSSSRARNFPPMVQILAVAVLCDTLDTVYLLFLVGGLRRIRSSGKDDGSSVAVWQ